MDIGLYFGSFNPIHIGHLIIANQVANSAKVNQVWFVVSPQNPLKATSGLLNAYHRLHLVEISIMDNEKFKASNVEFGLPKPSFTIDTLTYLQEQYPKNSFSVIMGSDSYSNISKWKNYELLLKKYSFIIYERPGFPITKSKYLSNIYILKAPLLEISATNIRALIKKKLSVKYLVTDNVLLEIERNGYYT